jgi:hypothetical protein
MNVALQKPWTIERFLGWIGTLTLPALGIDISVAAFYEDVVFDT